MPDSTDLEIMLQSKIPLIVIETYDEPRALLMIKKAAIKLGKPVYQWAITEGIARIDWDSTGDEDPNLDPETVLRWIKRSTSPAIYVLCDFHPYMDEPKHIRLLKEIAMTHDQHLHGVVLLSHEFTIPAEVARYSGQMSLALPTDEQLLQLVKTEAAAWSKQNLGKKVKSDTKTLNQLVANLRGLTYADARRLARGVIVDDGAITASDLPELNRAKFNLLGKAGVLSFEYDTASFADVGGLNNLKTWLNQRQKAFMDPQAAVDRPKGVLLLGVQGGGKSLAAKAVAGVWGVPLLRLDIAALYNKFIGETEKNLRESLAHADTLAPCVLWIDEIEKALSVADTDNGVSRRLLGSLLTWMSERKKSVFVVATSNDISLLPPELIRKGRLDEIFFVDLPDHATRIEILSIHLDKRAQRLDLLDLSLLAEQSEGFSGAEIEQAVVTALYRCQAEGVELDQSHLQEAIVSTQPLATVMAERVAALRQWAQERTVSA